MKRLHIGFFVALASLTACSKPAQFYLDKGLEVAVTSDNDENFRPAKGYISNPKSAAEIAEIIVKDFYGDAQIEEQKPYLVTRQGDIWIVRGTFHNDSGNRVGGTFEIRLSAIDGRVVRMIHGK